MGQSIMLWPFLFLGGGMNECEYIDFVNRHLNPGSDLPQLDLQRLLRWARLGLLVPENGEYEDTDLPRTIALLVLERSLVDKDKAAAKER